MFRPPSFHPHGGPPRHNAPYPGPSAGVTVGAPFVSQTFPGHGRGSFHTPFHGGGASYHGFSPSGLPPPGRPPPPPGSPPSEAPPPPPPSEANNFRPPPKPAPPPPPPMPKDPEMLKNIEVLSSFVVKNGPQFENMARAKQAGDPKFAFLFGGEWGTEAALGFDFYNWKKDHLMWVEERSKASPADQQKASEPNVQGHHGGSGVSRVSQESPASPAGSDMDMEDDFALPFPTVEDERNSDRSPEIPSPAPEKKLGLSPTAIEKKLGSSSPARERKSGFSSLPFEKRQQGLPVSASEKKVTLLSHGSMELKLGTTKLNVSVDRDTFQQAPSRGLSGQPAVPEVQSLGADAHGGNTSKVSDVSRCQKEAVHSDLSRRRDARRRTGFDRPCMEDLSSQCTSFRAEQKEAYPAHQREPHPVLDSGKKVISSDGPWETPVKPSRWGPLELGSEHLESGESGGKAIDLGETSLSGKGNKKSDSCTQNRDCSARDRSESPDVAAKLLRAGDDCNVKNTEKSKSKSGLSQPAVDEFGRLLRKGGSDSDGDDNHYSGSKKRRRTSSRSRSGSHSPGDGRYRHWSPSHSPHWWGRRSRSWSHSPRRNRTRSPPREGRWGGEGRGDRGPSERGGRRGCRGGGGPPPSCFDFVKGKCFRGSSCRFLHDESKGITSDQGNRWGNGRGRGQGQSGRESGLEGERNWGGRSGEDAKPRRAWESNDLTMEDDSRQRKVVEDLRKAESSSDESSKQEKGDSQKSVVKSAEAGQTAKSLAGSLEFSAKLFAPSAPLPPTLESESCISRTPASETDQQISVSPNPVLSQQPSGFSSISTSSTHKLGSLVSTAVTHQSPFMVSPTPQSQQYQFSPTPHSQQPAFPMTLNPQQLGYQPNLPPLSLNKGFTSNTLHQQLPPFTTTPNILSGSPPVPIRQPPLAPLPMARLQSSFSASHSVNFPPFAINSGHGGIHFRPMVGAAQPSMLQNPVGQNLLLPRPALPWMPPPGGGGPSVSYSLGPPQPPHTQPPPHIQATPLPASTGSTIVYSYTRPVSYALPSYSVLPSENVALQPPFTNDQYDPLADSLEPAPPGENKGLLPSIQSSSQEHLARPSAVQQWGNNPGCISTPLMMNPGEVVLENVSPGLPGHAMDNVRMGNGVLGNSSPGPQSQMIMENVSPTDMGSSLKAKSLISSARAEQRILIENVSPPDENPAGAGDLHKESSTKVKDQKKKDKEGRVLNLIRKAVVDHVKDLLKPTWKEGQISKEAFKTIAKKAGDKVMGALQAKGQIPKSQDKLDIFMNTSKPKIAKLVQGYVDKYMKA